MKRLVHVFLSFLLIISTVLFCTNNSIEVDAKTFDDMSSKSYVVIDNSGNILIEKNSSDKREVASICKLMTTLITLEYIENGNISLDDKFMVSVHASEAEGSQAFLDAGSEYSIRDLLKSVIVASANDSAIVLAEGIAGTEEEFVNIMNNRAKELSMENTLYSNATGLEGEEQYSTALDTAILLNEVSKYDLYKDDCQIWMDKLIHPSGRETELVNTNRLIKYYNYCQTGKTGFTDPAGYCLSSTAFKNDLKLTCVVLGCNSSADRFTESVELYNYCYANFVNEKIINKEDNIDNKINVYNGNENTVTIHAKYDYSYTQNKNNRKEVSVKYELPKTIKAPIKIGDEVGNILVIVEGEIVKQIPIVASQEVNRQTYGDIVHKVIDKFDIF